MSASYIVSVCRLTFNFGGLGGTFWPYFRRALSEQRHSRDHSYSTCLVVVLYGILSGLVWMANLSIDRRSSICRQTNLRVHVFPSLLVVFLPLLNSHLTPS